MGSIGQHFLNRKVRALHLKNDSLLCIFAAPVKKIISVKLKNAKKLSLFFEGDAVAEWSRHC